MNFYECGVNQSFYLGDYRDYTLINLRKYKDSFI